MKPHYQSGPVTLYHGASEVVMKSFADSSIDAIVTDPPYELGFMGKGWDSSGIAYSVELWAEALRVLKPGGHLLAFGGSRTFHRMAVAIEDSGFELRDSIAWLYAQGMPKSPNVGRLLHELGHTSEAAKWRGFSAQLRPSFESIVIARAPFAGTLAENVLAHGVGAFNIDGCRFGGKSTSAALRAAARDAAQAGVSWGTSGIASSAPTSASWAANPSDDKGRWPANAVLDEDQANSLDMQVGIRNSGYGDTGHASRFFPTFKYEAKAPKSERPVVDGVAHATVKPLALMRWLVRLVTPPGGVVLDPFAGSGTTLEAAVLEGFDSIGIELEEAHLPLIKSRFKKPFDQYLDLGDVG